MAYRVIHHNQELIIEKDYRYSAFMPGVFGVFLLFFALLAQTQANMPGQNLSDLSGILRGFAMLFAGGGLILIIAGIFFYSRVGRVIIDFEQDMVTVQPVIKRPQSIPFKKIDGLVIRKASVPASRHMEKTMGVSRVNHWELFLKTDHGTVALIDLYNELEVKRFLLEMEKGANWPVEHINI